MKVNILEARSQLSRLVNAALDGEEVVIARNGVPLVRLVPVGRLGGLIHFGRLRKLAAGVNTAFGPEADTEVAAHLDGRC